MSFLSELRKRKVFKVTVAYLVVAWVAIQAASIALPTFAAPIWVLRVLILLLAIGFPFALLLTWAVELGPEGARLSPAGPGTKRMYAVTAGLLLAAIAWFYWGRPPVADLKPAPRIAAAVATVPAVAARSIAVLPFVNMSGDKANEYFSDGLAETTLDMLAQVHDLKVIARTSSFAFKGKAQDMREIGKALDAAHLLEGSVQQAGDTVRITVQLIRASDGTHLWSRRYDRQLADVFKIQDEIATEVVKALQLALPAAEKKQLLRKRTDSVAAYREYLKGNALLPGRKVADMRRALQHFEKAIELDPSYARAYAAVAIASVLLDTYASLSPEEHQRRVAYTRKALQLSPDLGEAHIANATLLQSMRDIAGANREYARGIELAPGYANGFMWYAEFLMFELGEVEQSLRMYDRALALDPLSPIVRNEHANGLALAGRVDAALAEIAALLEDHPTLAPAHGLRARILESQGDLVGALRALRAQQQHDPDAVGRGLHRCYTLAAFGALDEAGSCIEAYKERFPAKEDALGAQVSLTALRADFATALALLMQRPHPDQWERAYLLMANGRDAEALALLKTLVPELFDTPAERATANFPGDIVMVGSTLLRTGATTHGQALLRRALQVNARYQHGQLHLGRGWWDVVARAQLGDIPGACVALKAAVDSGFYRDIPELDADPLAAPVRGDPCYSQVLAPARAKAAAQVAAARKAGLL